MRIRKFRLLILAIIVVFLIIFYKKVLNLPSQKQILLPTYELSNTKSAQEFSQLSVIIVEFEGFDNDLLNVCKSVLEACNYKCKIFIVSEDLVYPPLILPPTVKHVFINPDITKRTENIFKLIGTSTYVLLLPDGARISSPSQLTDYVNLLEAGDTEILSLTVGGNSLICHHYEFDIKAWTLVITPAPNSEACDGVSGRAAFLMRTTYFVNLTFPLLRPCALSLGIQGTAHKWKIHIGRGAVLGEGEPLYATDHLRWKLQTLEEERIKNLYRNLRIKKVVGANRNVQWYGCTRTSPRCFPTVANDTPSYLFEGRWTPPCCLEGLRSTARHVFQALKACRVRWWLEGGSLLGAVRSGDIIPWDYDVDIGVYAADVDKCPQLKASRWQTVEDNDGYVWQKAPNGYYKIFYSTANHLHVDVFPFYPRDGQMIKAGSWALGHRQDVDFPEHFLRPLSTISFTGVTASAPNNVRDFLEFKFGMSVIENPSYPNLDILRKFNSSLPSLD